MGALTELDIAGAIAAMDKGACSARELAAAHIAAMEGARPLNAFITETPEKALAMADAADTARARGAAGPLCGIPLAIKDLFCTDGVRTTAGSHILENFTPAYESTVSASLWHAGAVMLGKTNLDEFAMGSSNESSYFGPAINPWKAEGDDRERVPGGSSGGSTAAVAAGLAMAAIGTDTGGSIRQPAAFSGVVGLKPTYGRCSRWGVVAFASSLDHPGPITRTVMDAAIMLEAMAGFDWRDSTSVDVPATGFRAAVGGGVKGLKIGIPREFRIDGMAPEIEALWQTGIDWLRDAGATIVDISLPLTKYALPVYYIIAPAEASSNLARYDGVRYGLRDDGENLIDMYERSRAAGFGAEVRRRVLIGTYALSAGYYDAYYLKAQKVRGLIAGEFRAVFGDVDAILTPTAPSGAFALGEKSDDPIAMYLNDVFTVTADLAGIPAISVPAGKTADGLPLGLQVIGPAFDEAMVLRIGRVIEECAAFEGHPPAWWRQS